MSQILLAISKDSLLAPKLAPQELGEILTMAAAVKLFELGRPSSGAAARLPRIHRTIFLSPSV